MAQRLHQAFQRDPRFTDEGFPVEKDFPPAMVEEWKRDFGKKTAEELVMKKISSQWAYML